jgi:hypothetical protein
MSKDTGNNNNNNNINDLINSFLGNDESVKVNVKTNSVGATTLEHHQSKDTDATTTSHSLQRAKDLIFQCMSHLRNQVDINLIEPELQVLQQVYQNLNEKTKQALNSSNNASTTASSAVHPHVIANEQIDDNYNYNHNNNLEEKQKEQKQSSSEDQKIFEYLLQLTMEKTQIEYELQKHTGNTGTATADPFNVIDDNDNKIKLLEQLEIINSRILAASNRQEKLHHRFINKHSINNNTSVSSVAMASSIVQTNDELIQYQINVSLQYAADIKEAELKRQMIKERSVTPPHNIWENPELAMVEKLIHSLKQGIKECEDKIVNLMDQNPTDKDLDNNPYNILD